MNSRIIDIKENGISIHWKYLLIAVVVIFGGGGSWIGISLATTSQVEEKIQFQAEKQKACDKDQDQKIELNSKGIEEVRVISGQVKFKLNAVQEVQHRQIARDEARRITGTIVNRRRRETEYDRVYNLNMKRLERGADPCSSLSCD